MTGTGAGSAPILVVDFGTTTSAAALVVGEQIRIVREPGASASWPSVVYLDGDDLVVGTPAEETKHIRPEAYRAEFKRDFGQRDPVHLGGRAFTPEQLVTAVLTALKREAERLAGAPITRAVLTAPASYWPADPRRELMVSAGEAAGFTTVELLPEPVAAAMAPTAGQSLAPGDLVLVYDFGGGTFDTALVRIGEQVNEVLAHDALEGCGGRDIDSLVYAELTGAGGTRLAALLDPPDGLDETESVRVAARGRLELADLARRVKQQLSTRGVGEGMFARLLLLSLDRERLAQLAKPVLDRTVECCRRLLARAEVSPDDLAAVLLVGGTTHMPAVSDLVAEAFGPKLRTMEDAELAVVQGAAAFARNAPGRRLAPAVRAATDHPLRWTIPGEAATLLRWSVSRGDRFAEGQPLGDVRLADGSIWELSADRAGTVTRIHAPTGATVYSGDWLVTTRVAPSLLPTAVGVQQIRHRETVWGVAFDPSGALFAVGTNDGRLRVFETAGWKEQWHKKLPSWVWTVAFSPDGTRLASADGNKDAWVWEAETGAEVKRFRHDDAVRWVAFSPDGTRLATGGADNSARVWDIDGGVAERRYRHQHWVWQVAWSPDGTRLATASADKTVRVWDVVGGGELFRGQHDGEVRGVAFSPDGTRLASTSQDKTTRLWDPAGGTEIWRTLHEDAVRGVAFSPDGSRLAISSADKTARILDAATGDERLRVQVEGSAYNLAFSPDGTRLAVATENTNTRIWLIAQ